MHAHATCGDGGTLVGPFTFPTFPLVSIPFHIPSRVPTFSLHPRRIASQHLTSLLASEHTDVALAALYVLASTTRRPPGSRSNRFHADYKLRSR